MTTAPLRLGSLFSGYGGLEMAANQVLGSETAWVSDVCKFDKDGNAGHYEPHRGPCRILAHRYPDVPNLGDVTKVKWTPDCPACGGRMAVYRKHVEGAGDPLNEFAGTPFYWCPSCEREWDVSIRFDDPEAHLIPAPVDILTGGSPCQDLSHAGKRGGMTEGTRSNLWVTMREAIAQLRPQLVIWENVRGAYSAEADSDLESCPRCVGDPRDRGPVLRALGRVLGDLADLGFDAEWTGLRAADVGAPHGRFRVFVVAYPNDGGRGGVGWQHAVERDADRRSAANGLRSSSEPATLLPTPRTSDTNGAGAHGDSGIDLRTAVALMPTPTTQDGANNGGPSQLERNSVPLNAAVTLLPTPAVNDMGEGKTVEAWDEWTAKMLAAHGNGNGHGKSLSIEAQRLLPTPTVMDGPKNGDSPTEWDRHNPALTAVTYHLNRWGQYADAIARWEALTRPAPAPTQPSKKGTPQLSAAFSEWLMGLPAGWVTDVPGITRNEALKALGNGVVPQQAEAALRLMLGQLAVTA